jgi:hypothetical protein
VFGTHRPRLRNPPSDRIPWIRTEIIIIAERNALKGYRGIVLDVLCNQKTPSGLQVQIQLTSLDPNSPFKTFIFDYDNVVEAR